MSDSKVNLVPYGDISSSMQKKKLFLRETCLRLEMAFLLLQFLNEIRIPLSSLVPARFAVEKVPSNKPIINQSTFQDASCTLDTKRFTAHVLTSASDPQ